MAAGYGSWDIWKLAVLREKRLIGHVFSKVLFTKSVGYEKA